MQKKLFCCNSFLRSNLQAAWVHRLDLFEWSQCVWLWDIGLIKLPTEWHCSSGGSLGVFAHHSITLACNLGTIELITNKCLSSKSWMMNRSANANCSSGWTKSCFIDGSHLIKTPFCTFTIAQRYSKISLFFTRHNQVTTSSLVESQWIGTNMHSRYPWNSLTSV